jgi:hypothetical protein
MRLTSIETTPNPNSMKLNVDESVGKTTTYDKTHVGECPEAIARVLRIEGVQSVFACQNFLTVNRDPRCDWNGILDAAAKILGDINGVPREGAAKSDVSPHFDQANVFVQTFRGVPIQVKVTFAGGEKRIALDARFSQAAMTVQEHTGADYLKERYWADWGIRYGAPDEVAAEVAEEIQGGVDEARIAELIRIGSAQGSATAHSSTPCLEDLNSDDWHKRLHSLQQLKTDEHTLPLLIKALQDPHQQVRRLAAAALGASGAAAAVEPLCNALLNDDSVGVRRTAGDALSDLGDASAQGAVCKALGDANKLVRWRAARFLAELGDENAVPFLQGASEDSEFEVRLEIQAALARIAGGKEGSVPAWKRILGTDY